MISRRSLVTIAVMSSAVMEVLDTSVVNVSLPHIAGNLSATTEEATWVLTSYLVANAIILPMSGWLANYFGRKRILLTVVTGFTVSSLLCGLAPSLPMLIFFRVMQGITGGGLQPLSQAVLLEEFPPKERGKAMGFFGLGIVAAPILGPTLGGWITDAYSWRWVFYINLPVGIASLILISLFVIDPPYMRRGSLRADFWGFGMLAVGMGALQIMLDKGQEDDWFGSRFIVSLAIDQPIVHLDLLKYRSFAAGIFFVTVLGFVLYSSLVLLPLFMQTLLGWTSATAGLWTSPRGIGTALCMPLVGYLLGRGWDGRWMLAFGFALGGISLLGFSHMNLQSGTWDILVWQISQGLGMSFVFVPLTTLAMDPIPKRETGYATALYSVMRNIGSSVGISFVTTWLARRAQFNQSVLGAHVTPYDPAPRQMLSQAQAMLVRNGADPMTANRQAVAMLYGEVQRQASVLSFLTVFRVIGIVFLAIIPLVLILRKPKHLREPITVLPSPNGDLRHPLVE
jgi:MFS transporter, DHA2 family, multidrug resistance protein